MLSRESTEQKDEAVERKFSIRGSLFGVDLTDRGESDPHIMLTVLVEDDEHWHRKLSFSSHWIDDLIETLKQAKRECKRLGKPSALGYGYEFKAPPPVQSPENSQLK